MKLFTLLLASLVACSAQIQMKYWKATDSVSQTVARKVPKDLDGYLTVVCNVGQAAQVFNPAWLALNSGDIRVQYGSAVLLAATIARNDALWPKLLRAGQKTATVGAISAGAAVATGGVSIPVEWAVGVGIGAALSPKITEELKAQTITNPPANFLPMGITEPAHEIPLAGCEWWTFAAAKGGPNVRDVTLPLLTPAVAEVKPEPAPKAALPDPPKETAVMRTVVDLEAAFGVSH